MDDHNEVIELPDSNKITFKHIARSLMNREKANKLKARAYILMGQLNEMEIKKKSRKTEDQYIKVALQKTTLDRYLMCLAKYPADCSPLSKATITKFWMNEKTILEPTRLNVYQV